MKKLIHWIKLSMDGEDERPSHRKLTTFAMVMMACFMIFASKVNTQIHLYAFYAILTVVCVLIGVVTISDILKFFGRGGSDKDEKMTGLPKFKAPEPPIKPGDEIQVTVTDIKTNKDEL